MIIPVPIARSNAVVYGIRPCNPLMPLSVAFRQRGQSP